MSDHVKQNFGLLVLFLMFLILAALFVFSAHFPDNNGIIEALKLEMTTVVGAIVGIVQGSRMQTQRNGDPSPTAPKAVTTGVAA